MGRLATDSALIANPNHDIRHHRPPYSLPLQRKLAGIGSLTQAKSERSVSSIVSTNQMILAWRGSHEQLKIYPVSVQEEHKKIRETTLSDRYLKQTLFNAV